MTAKALPFIKQKKSILFDTQKMGNNKKFKF